MSYESDIEVLRSKVIPYLKTQKQKLKEYPEPDHNDPTFKRVEILLSASPENVVLEKREILQSEAKAKLILNIEYEASVNLPSLFKQMLNNGWEENGILVDWFDILTLKFSDTLKDASQPKVKQAFIDRLLSDIRIDTQVLKVNLEAAIDEISGALMQIKELIAREWSKVEIWIANTQITLQNINTNLIESKSTLDEIKDVSALLIREVELLPNRVNSLLHRQNAEQLHELILELFRLEDDHSNTRSQLNLCEADLKLSPSDKYIMLSQTQLKNTLLQLEQTIAIKKSELNKLYDVNFNVIFLKREVVLKLEDNEGAVATCSDSIQMRAMQDVEYYEDVFTHDGKLVDINTYPGKLVNIRREAGKSIVTTKFDKVFKRKEILTYKSSCRILDSHTENNEYFMVWSGFPTLHLIIKIIFPIDRKFNSFQLYLKNNAFDRASSLLNLPTTIEEVDGGVALIFEIYKPKLFDRYKIEWSW